MIMKKFIQYFSIILLLFASSTMNAWAENYNVMLNGVKQSLNGTLTIQNNKECIIVGTSVYHVVSRTERSMGDVNGDGKITIADVTALVNIILGHGTAEPAVIYNVELAGNVTGIVDGEYIIEWGGVSEDGSLDPAVKSQRS